LRKKKREVRGRERGDEKKKIHKNESEAGR